jgi:hypothetical protein
VNPGFHWNHFGGLQTNAKNAHYHDDFLCRE